VTRYHIRRTPGRRETLTAAAVAAAAAAGVGLLTFYLSRLLLSREVLEPPPGRRDIVGAGEGGGSGDAG